MPAEHLNPDIDGPEAATAEDFGPESGQRVLKDALAAAERVLLEAARSAEGVIKEGVEALRAQTKAYSGPTRQTVDEAQRYIVERVKERPVTATLAGLGVGFLLGLVLSGRGK